MNESNFEHQRSRVKVSVLEDHNLLAGLMSRVLTDAGYEVVHVSATVAAGLMNIEEVTPNLAILDLDLPDGSGINVARKLDQIDPSVRIIFLSDFFTAPDLLSRELKNNWSYMRKTNLKSTEAFLEGIRLALSMSVVDSEFSASSTWLDLTLDMLRPQSYEILKCLGDGMSNLAIAQKLHMSTKTVEQRLTSIYQAIGLSPDAEIHQRVSAARTYWEHTYKVHLPGMASQ